MRSQILRKTVTLQNSNVTQICVNKNNNVSYTNKLLNRVFHRLLTVIKHVPWYTYDPDMLE
jgi:hypothetical protein